MQPGRRLVIVLEKLVIAKLESMQRKWTFEGLGTATGRWACCSPADVELASEMASYLIYIFAG